MPTDNKQVSGSGSYLTRLKRAAQKVEDAAASAAGFVSRHATTKPITPRGAGSMNKAAQRQKPHTLGPRP